MFKQKWFSETYANARLSLYNQRYYFILPSCNWRIFLFRINASHTVSKTFFSIRFQNYSSGSRILLGTKKAMQQPPMRPQLVRQERRQLWRWQQRMIIKHLLALLVQLLLALVPTILCRHSVKGMYFIIYIILYEC